MADKVLNVVIVGGSLTGLLHGIVLKRLGHNVNILERSTSLNGQGAGIMAREHVQAFFSKHDHCDQPYFVKGEPPQLQFLNKAGTITRVWKTPLCTTSWDTLYYRLRANYDGLQSDYVPEPPNREKGDGKATYENGCTVTNLKHGDGVVTLDFERSIDGGGGGTLHADLVIAADGPGSGIRRMIYPNAERNYVGYAAWRGTILESEVSGEAKALFGSCCNFFYYNSGHILLYTIPGKKGSLQPGQRLFNYVWYCNYPDGSSSLDNLMTDIEGHKHRITIPIGKMRPEVWSSQKKYAREILPAPIAELVEKTKQPFVQCITDVFAPKAVHYEGKLLLAGDALCNFRPHVGASTNQAAFNALQLEKFMKGQSTLQEWESECMQYAKITSRTGIALGNWNQYGLWKTLLSAIRLFQAYLAMYVAKLWK